MQTFSIQTLGCKVNQYESEQLAELLRRRGMVQVDPPQAELRIINTCSVTMQAGSKSRQTVRRSTKLQVLTPGHADPNPRDQFTYPSDFSAGTGGGRGRVLVTGCWATSDRAQASAIRGVDAVLGHHDDIAGELNRLLDQWNEQDRLAAQAPPPVEQHKHDSPLEPFRYDGKNNSLAGAPARFRAEDNRPRNRLHVKENPAIGARHLPLLQEHCDGHQRAFLKIQDGCDAHCTYCIIPQLRPSLWSKPIDDAVEEAKRLVAAGHREIVLTGIFLGAYGHATALRRRQAPDAALPLGELIEALCARVGGLRRLRLSSLEPGDLTGDLIAVLRSHPQVVPHFHLPLQSGSDDILRRMNRQYTRDQFLRMIDQVHAAFDRPAITTDIIVGFPGESDAEFAYTLDIVHRVRFIHTHAFTFSPRPGTAAARWDGEFIRGPVVNERIDLLNALAREHSHSFRQQFLGETVEVLVEQPQDPSSPLRHGRCERYFDVYFHDIAAKPGDTVRLRLERVTPQRTWGSCL
jgi:threonylcarbamoyladenosine tRNA methylthiotransferase MtaB